MHHGCIMLDSNLTNVADALKVKDAKFESKSVKSVRSRVTTINANAPKPITMAEFKNLLKEQIFLHNDLEQMVLTEEQLSEIQKLRDEKYATWDWNYGFSPAYEMKKEKKFSAGLVSVLMSTEKGRIKSVRFYGDFFGNDDISKLEAALVGQPLDSCLEQTLAQIRLSDFISGVSAKELYQFLVY